MRQGLQAGQRREPQPAADRLVPADSKLKILADVVTTAKKESKAVNFGTFATGYRLATEYFSNIAGVRFTNVPYENTSQMNTDPMGSY